MGSRPIVIGGVNQIIDAGRIHIPCRIMFHCLEVQIGAARHSLVTATRTITDDGAGDVSAMTGIGICGRAITDHVNLGIDSTTEVSVVVVDSGVGHCDDFSRAIQRCGEIWIARLKSIDLHMVA